MSFFWIFLSIICFLCSFLHVSFFHECELMKMSTGINCGPIIVLQSRCQCLRVWRVAHVLARCYLFLCELQRMNEREKRRFFPCFMSFFHFCKFRNTFILHLMFACSLFFYGIGMSGDLTKTIWSDGTSNIPADRPLGLTLTFLFFALRCLTFGSLLR